MVVNSLQRHINTFRHSLERKGEQKLFQLLISSAKIFFLFLLPSWRAIVFFRDGSSQENNRDDKSTGWQARLSLFWTKWNRHVLLMFLWMTFYLRKDWLDDKEFVCFSGLCRPLIVRDILTRCQKVFFKPFHRVESDSCFNLISVYSTPNGNIYSNKKRSKINWVYLKSI